MKDIFSRYMILGWKSFSFSTLNYCVTSFWLLWFLIKSLLSFVLFFYLKVRYCFVWVLSRFFFLIFSFQELKYVSWHGFFLVYSSRSSVSVYYCVYNTLWMVLLKKMKEYLLVLLKITSYLTNWELLYNMDIKLMKINKK